MLIHQVFHTNYNILLTIIITIFIADDESDENPHNDIDGGSDLDCHYSNGFNLSSHLNIGQHSFSQMQVRNFYECF